MAAHVNVDNFVRAETDRMFGHLQRDAGGINRFSHNREPASVERQTVIRMNRDTLYSFAVVDISQGASVTVPEHHDRYVSVMVVNQDHYVNAIFHDPGAYELTEAQFRRPYVLLAARTLVDPGDAADVEAVGALQDQLGLSAKSLRPFESPEYDTDSFDTTRPALLTLAGGLTSFSKTFGTKEDVEPVRHLIGTAAGWGGLPSEEPRTSGSPPDSPSAATS